MSDTNPASSQPPMLTVALDLPSAQVLADQASIVSDLQFVVECCKGLLGELDKPEEERDSVVPQALWSAALASYSRCFSKGKRFGLGADDITSLPLEGEVMTFHKWAIGQRTMLTTHPTDPFDAAKVGAGLARPGQGKRRVTGIAILTTSRVLVDDTGVRQLGALASALAKQTAERAPEAAGHRAGRGAAARPGPPLPPAPAQQRQPATQPAHPSPAVRLTHPFLGQARPPHRPAAPPGLTPTISTWVTSIMASAWLASTPPAKRASWRVICPGLGARSVGKVGGRASVARGPPGGGLSGAGAGDRVGPFGPNR